MADDHTFAVMKMPEEAGWTCYMFGNRPGGHGLMYRPTKGRLPNLFVRLMMRVCFDCRWVKDKPNG